MYNNGPVDKGGEYVRSMVEYNKAAAWQNLLKQESAAIPPALRIDSKRRRRLQEKRMDMGHKRDDHEDEQLYHVNDNTMQ